MKYAWIEKHRDEFHVTRMCRQLGVSRTGFCQWSTRAPSDRSMANEVVEKVLSSILPGGREFCNIGYRIMVR